MNAAPHTALCRHICPRGLSRKHKHHRPGTSQTTTHAQYGKTGTNQHANSAQNKENTQNIESFTQSSSRLAERSDLAKHRQRPRTPSWHASVRSDVDDVQSMSCARARVQSTVAPSSQQCCDAHECSFYSCVCSARTWQNKVPAVLAHTGPTHGTARCACVKMY